LRLDPKGRREQSLRISKKCGVQNSMLNFKRNDGVSNSLEAPIGDKYEIF
jgi:hypothetical protein